MISSLTFSQIWLSSFVNELEKTAGIAYKKIAAVYKGYNLKFFYGKEDAKKVAEHVVDRFVNEPGFAKKVNEEILRSVDALRADAQKIPLKDMDKLSNEEIWSIILRQDLLHTEYYEWGWIPNASDMFHDVFSSVLKKHLSDIGISEKDSNEYFIILTSPSEKSIIQIEQEEFLSQALKIKKDNYHRNLFIELYRNFSEIDNAKFGYKTHTKEYEEMLEKKSAELLGFIKPEIQKIIRAHYRKYFYVNHMWVGKEYTLEHYLKELVKLIGRHSDIEAMLADIKRDFEKMVSDKEKTKKKVMLDSRWEDLFDEFGKFMLTKMYRRYAQIFAMYKMEFILKEVARRTKLTLKQARFMLPREVRKALLEGYVDRQELEERSEFCVYYAEKDKDMVITGQTAKRIADEIMKEDIGKVSEIKGQVACLGKAKGHVKIIIRPDDMAKMKKGDILVSIATDPDIVPAMKKAAAIVTEQGGVTSHAAIVSRELGTPCVIGTKIATRVFHDGDTVEVDAEKGIVKRI
jgi:phosphoenolpyruvate synthase/pyruvate phosphate dikinase